MTLGNVQRFEQRIAELQARLEAGISEAPEARTISEEIARLIWIWESLVGSN